MLKRPSEVTEALGAVLRAGMPTNASILGLYLEQVEAELAALREAAEAWEAVEKLVDAGDDVTMRCLRQGIAPAYEVNSRFSLSLQDAVLAAAQAQEKTP